MASQEETLASMRSHAENSDNVMGGSDSRVKENVGRISDVRNDGDGSSMDNGEKLNASGITGQGNGEKLEGSDHRFLVGDLVWSKDKNDPWWPGQIHDSKDVSELGASYSQEGHLLVACFGDGSCSWCLPSDLMPFVENFKEMSMHSSSRRFHKAIQGALDEVGRLVESDMICKCVPLEKRDGLARPVVENIGLKEGILAPEVDIRRLSVPNYKPAEILSKVMHFAKGVSVDSALEVAFLKSSLSAFYRAKGGYRLPAYHEPVFIEGLEDKNEDESAVANDFSVPIEGPKEDEWLSSSIDATETPGAPSNAKTYHKRKKRSVAELMEDNTDIKLKNQKEAIVKDGKDVGKSPSSLKRNKRNRGEVEEGGRKTKVAISEPSSLKRKKRNRGEVEEGGRKTKVAISEPSSLKRKKRNRGEVEEGGRKTKVAISEPLSLKRKKRNRGEVEEGGRKTTVSISKPAKTTNKNVSNAKKRKKIDVAAAKSTSGKALEELEMVSKPRERKKSRYLSPPYTDFGLKIGISSTKRESKPVKVT